jgi:hypothetical protein
MKFLQSIYIYIYLFARDRMAALTQWLGTGGIEFNERIRDVCDLSGKLAVVLHPYFLVSSHL